MPSPSTRIALLLLILLDGGVATAAKSPACSTRADGNARINESVLRVKRKPAILVTGTQRYDPDTRVEVFESALKRGRKVVYTVETTYRPDGVIIQTQRFGAGFKGVAEIAIRAGGGAVDVTVDGRHVTVTGHGTGTQTLAFDDGQPPPALKVKRDVVKLLKKLQKLGAVQCEPPASVTGIRPASITGSDCDDCFNLCGAKSYACFAGEVVTCALTAGIGCGVASILEFVDSGVSCTDATMACVDGCNAKGGACCRGFCGDQCCGRDETPETRLCLGATAEFAGTCCTQQDRCGETCCGSACNRDTCFPTVCADEGRELCCAAGDTPCGGECCSSSQVCADAGKDLCCAPGLDPCGSVCCPSGQRCLVPGESLEDAECVICPAGKTGPGCGETCCAADEVCGFGNECCKASELCGGTCCSPGNCRNGGCCDLPSVPCGNTCCPGLTTTCCNGQCCAGTCIGGSQCCPAGRECGPTCCAEGSACVNPATGQCQACAAGHEPCPFSEGTPLCCPTGTACCNNGACCATPNHECCDFGNGPVCASTCTR